ncbi:cullin of plant origin [Cryptosporidium sp. chipmunk genotype I]|uniref:cullin of plant origin n=1 Tax=Cryptosporidium sp. chipmunk genotype I TaxID=1280935 RepID=UPI003519E3CC|nr:cullin of plant origin [Cryptosporidium sp. chipmunk genotype I]
MSASLSCEYTNSNKNIGFEEGWAQIKKEAIEPLEVYLLNRDNINSTVKNLFTAQEYSKIYTLIYNMCTQNPRNWSRQLFAKYSETIENFLKENVLRALRNSTGSKLLFEFRLLWSNHLIYTHWMERFFGYLNKYHVKIVGEGSLMLKGITIFYETVYLEFKESISFSFSNSIQDYRLGTNDIDSELLKGVVNVCLEMSEKSRISEIYENEIEKVVISRINSHYRSLAPKWVRHDKLLEYLSRVDEIVNFENKLCTKCLVDSTWKKIQKSLTQILLADEIKVILSDSSSIKDMFVNNEFEQLKLLFRLFSTIHHGIHALNTQFKHYLTECGQMIVNKFSESIHFAQDAEIDNEETFEPIQSTSNLTSSWPWMLGKSITVPFLNTRHGVLFVQTIISLFDHSIYLLETCFNNDTAVQKTIRESFEVIVNLEVGCQNQAKLVCYYCDLLLKNSHSKSGNGTNVQLNDQFTVLGRKLVEVFSYIHFQDYFLQIYKFLLAKRLLQYNLSLEKNELYIISLLKNKCGTGFTSKLEGMIMDIQMAQSLNTKFKEYLKDITRGEIENNELEIKDNQMLDLSLQMFKVPISTKIDFTVNVLTSSNWPTLDSSSMNLPANLKKCISDFETFYSLETNHRKLSWVYWYGQCVLDYKLPTPNGVVKCFEIHCNTYQACILLQFNNFISLSLLELQNLLNTEKSIILKHIKPLYSDVKIFKMIDVQIASDNPVFELNLDFVSTDNMSPTIIKLPNQTETTQKNRTEYDKSHAIEAAIVKIMKVKGEMTRSDIISYVSSQLCDYKPSEGIIIDKIKYLVEREYLENHHDDPDKLLYLT